MTDGLASAYILRPAGAAAHPRDAIARAAERTGVNFDYLLAQAQIESGMDPQAQARTSSASGLFQFIDQTWLATLDRHGERLGYGPLAQAIETVGGKSRIVDPSLRSTIMQLRFDPAASSLMAGALASDNKAALQTVLGRDPDASELYLAHFLGAPNASRFLEVLGQDPDSSAVALLPRAAAANRAIFRKPGGAPRSVAEVMAVIRQKVETAMGSGSDTTVAPVPPGGFSPIRSRMAARGPVPALQPPRPLSLTGQLPSMAQTLRASFSLDQGGAGTMPGNAHVRSAYARLEAFGL